MRIGITSNNSELKYLTWKQHGSTNLDIINNCEASSLKFDEKILICWQVFDLSDDVKRERGITHTTTEYILN